MLYVMADELILHSTKPGLICSCGHKYRPGDSIAIHKSLAVSIAVSLSELGVRAESLHEAVMSVLPLVDSPKY